MYQAITQLKLSLVIDNSVKMDLYNNIDTLLFIYSYRPDGNVLHKSNVLMKRLQQILRDSILTLLPEYTKKDNCNLILLNSRCNYIKSLGSNNEKIN